MNFIDTTTGDPVSDPDPEQLVMSGDFLSAVQQVGVSLDKLIEALTIIQAAKKVPVSA